MSQARSSRGRLNHHLAGGSRQGQLPRGFTARRRWPATHVSRDTPWPTSLVGLRLPPTNAWAKAEVTRNRHLGDTHCPCRPRAAWYRWPLDCPRVSHRERNVLAPSHDATTPLSACDPRLRPAFVHGRIITKGCPEQEVTPTSTRSVSDVCAVTCRIDHRRTGVSHPVGGGFKGESTLQLIG